MTSILTVVLTLQLQVPAPVGFVNDYADVINEATERQMLAVIEEVRTKSSGEIVVVTLRDLGGRASIDVARDIGREWQVGARGGPGDPARNAGVVLLLKPGERPGDGQAELAIGTGTGAEGFVTDALSGRIRDAIGEAAVEAGSYGVGLLIGVRLLAEAYAREFDFALTGEPVPQTRRRPERRAPGAGLIGVLAVMFFFLVLPAILRANRYGGRRGRRYYRGTHRGLEWMLLGMLLGGGRRGGGWGGGGFGGGGGGGFGGFGGGGGFSGGGASGRF